MPANLTPQYKDAEQRFRQATAHAEKLEALREMLALLPRHKGTEKIQADLRRRLAKLEEEGERGGQRGPHRADPGHVHREGAGQWVLLGPPNAGKSALLRALTHAHPEVAAYPFTTRLPLPGMMEFEDVQVQIVDAPAVTAQHGEPWMANLVRNADGLLLVLDPADDGLPEALAAIRALIERARVRRRGQAPGPEAPPTVVEKPVLVVLNKQDQDPDGTFAALAREGLDLELPILVASAERGDGLADLRAKLFTELNRIRIYAKEPGKPPDRQRPFVLPAGATVADLARAVHKEVAEGLRFARLWGAARFDGQHVDGHHVLADRDVVELHT